MGGIIIATMEWTDRGIVLATRPHGDSAAIATMLTREHGLHAGLVLGGRSSRLRGMLEPGTLVAARWSGRLPEQLGRFGVEGVRAYAAEVLDDPLRLSAIVAVCALLDMALAERQPVPAIFDGAMAYLGFLGSEVWAEAYVRWELGLLGALGFGLDLDRCAVTGGNDFLAYVSPRTGRAVSAAAAGPFRDRLLPLPGFLVGRAVGGGRDVVDGLALTGHFLERHVFHGPLPPARARLALRLAQAAACG